MKRILLLTVCLGAMMTVRAQEVMYIPKNDVKALLVAIEVANKKNAEKDSKPFYIMIPDGFYDLGGTVLTQITGHHIALIGQSMEGTIIQNKPDIKQEGISKTAIFVNRGSNNYFQDLTLKNALDYYAAGSAGRAVTLQDKGTHTICNRVALLSYQDTYYSDNDLCQHYFQDSEIHGTVDFICGDGDVWFERCRIVTEKRSANGSGRDVIAAPKTSKTAWGYVFNRCSIENIISPFEYARGWHSTPRCIWLYTTLLTPEKLNANRFDTRGMNTVTSIFREYHTMNAQGQDITPKTNVLTFSMQRKKVENGQDVIIEREHTTETILTDDEAAQYSVANVFGDWHPDEVIRQVEKKAQQLKKRLK